MISSAGLLADAPHEPDVADRQVEELADGRHAHAVERVGGAGAQAQHRHERLGVGLVQLDPERDLAAAGRRDRPPLGQEEQLAPGAEHLLGVVEPPRRVAVERLAEEGRQAVADRRVEPLGLDRQRVVGQRRVGLAVAP